MGCLIFVRFLQVTAELLIGAEGRAFIVHLTPNHYLLYGLAANPGSVRPTAPGHGRSLGPVPSTHLQKPPWEDASPSHPAKARKTARQASGERPIWIASAIADGPSIVGA